jgi:hypothetical protein
VIIDSELATLADFRADNAKAKIQFREVEGGADSLNGCFAYLLGKHMPIFSITLARRYLFDVGFEFPQLMARFHSELESSATNDMLLLEKSLEIRVACIEALLISRYLRNRAGFLMESSDLPFAEILEAASRQTTQANDMQFAQAIGNAALIALVTDQPKVAKDLLALRKKFKFFPKAEKLLRGLADSMNAQSDKSKFVPLEIDQGTRELFFWIFDDYRTRERRPEQMFTSDAIQLCNSDPGCILLADFYLRRLSSKPSPVPSFDDVKRLVTWKGI